VQREVIERQVVVMRCRFCKELTPAELSACKSCGALMGGA
jgi:rRNA maturation endonuclease Nob1